MAVAHEVYCECNDLENMQTSAIEFIGKHKCQRVASPEDEGKDKSEENDRDPISSRERTVNQSEEGLKE